MFDLLPVVYSFTKPYIATFFHPFYAKRREKNLFVFLPRLPSSQLFFTSFAQKLITYPYLFL